ncbi:MAG: metalloregulator ArsR/SmtB family transcription factor [Streptosporangiaceae bacterium]
MSKSLIVLDPAEAVACCTPASPASQVSLPSGQTGTAVCCAPLSQGPLSPGQAEQVAPLLKALADPVRLRLMSLVASHPGGEACVCDLSDAFDLSQPTISHHLKVLHDSGLLDREKRGVWVYYRARAQALASPGAPIGYPAP